MEADASPLKNDVTAKNEQTLTLLLPDSPGYTASASGECPSAASVLSKRALKREARRAKWEEQKKLRRQNEREKKKQKKLRSKNANTEFSRTALKRRKMVTSECKIGVVIDLSFDDHMVEKELNFTVKQVQRCYSVNRRQPQPLQFHVTSFDGESAGMMKKHEGFTNWDVQFHEDSFDKVFDKSSVVYLTSDSDNVLTTLEPHKFYIIGGLVDHNSKKGLCYQTALEKNVSHARLPIEEFLDMKTRKVLSIVHVFEILAKVAGGMAWAEALLSSIPARKQAESKDVTVAQEGQDVEGNDD